MNYGYGSDSNTLDLTLVYKDKVLGEAAIYQ